MTNTIVTIPGYETLKLIYTGTRTLVYRGTQALDQKPAIVKLLCNKLNYSLCNVRRCLLLVIWLQELRTRLTTQLGLFNQVFMNLLANAIDAIQDSNRSWVMANSKASSNSPLPTIRISTQLNQEFTDVLIRISDNGVGMSEEVKRHVFDHLFTTKAVGKGTGLGLAIARQIVVEKHQGTLSLYSQLGQSSEFLITITLKS